MYCLLCQSPCRPRTCVPRTTFPGSALFAPRTHKVLGVNRTCTTAEAAYARNVPQCGALHKQHVDRILIVCPAEGATTDVNRLALRKGNASGADVTWRRKSHSTGPSTNRPPLKSGHALPRPIRSCWRVAELPPDILHDSLACCSMLIPISGWTLFLVSIFLLSGFCPVALSVSAPVAS